MPHADTETLTAQLAEVEDLLQRGEAQQALLRCSALLADADLPVAMAADLCNLAGAAAHALGQAAMAETLWQQALAHAEGDAAAGPLINLGVLYAGQRRRADAEAAYRRALALDPDNATALTNLGVLLADLDRAAEAEACQRRALALAPDDAAIHTNLGLLLQALRRHAEAEVCQRRAVALAPQRAEVHTNLGNLLAEHGDPREAESALRRALALTPDSAAARLNLGVFCTAQRRDAEAEAFLRDALALRPVYPLAELALSRLLLAQGRFAEGWRRHEARHDPALLDNGIPPPDLAIPAWRGESLAGRALLVWPEQGFGDQIQFCRYVPWLKQQGAARVTLVCQRPLAALFASLPGVDAVVAADVADNAFHAPGTDLSGHDFWTFPLSLPRFKGTDLVTLPDAPMPYLRAAPALGAAWAARWQAAEADDGGARALRVGLVWRGNPKHDNDAERSMPGPETLAPLWSVPGVRFASLQAGRTAGEAPLLDWGNELRDFADTAAALSALDLLICVDTSIAHLAGAMGRPCWVLLPQHRTDWRWLRERADSPCYPLGMRLFRQPARGAWTPVVEQVRAALQRLALEARP
jgi:Flp pilus assembly protein TadD